MIQILQEAFSCSSGVLGAGLVEMSNYEYVGSLAGISPISPIYFPAINETRRYLKA